MCRQILVLIRQNSRSKLDFVIICIFDCAFMIITSNAGFYSFRLLFLLDKPSKYLHPLWLSKLLKLCLILVYTHLYFILIIFLVIYFIFLPFCFIFKLS